MPRRSREYSPDNRKSTFSPDRTRSAPRVPKLSSLFSFVFVVRLRL